MYSDGSTFPGGSAYSFLIMNSWCDNVGCSNEIHTCLYALFTIANSIAF